MGGDVVGCCGKVAGAVKFARAEIGLAVLRDDALVAARRKACEACERWDHGRCLECSCYTWAKSRIPKERCPLGRWPGETADKR